MIVNTKLQRNPFQGRGGVTYDIEGTDWVDSEYKITEKSLPGGGGGFTYDIVGRDWVDSEYKLQRSPIQGERGGTGLVHGVAYHSIFGLSSCI